jgi:hypothetical protein
MEIKDHGGRLTLRDKTTASSSSLFVGAGAVTFNLDATEMGHDEAERRGNKFWEAFLAAQTEEEKEKAENLFRLPGSMIMLAARNRASVELSENGRTRAVLGHTSLVTKRTGVVEERPVSSLVLFDKDGTVLWRAP